MRKLFVTLLIITIVVACQQKGPVADSIFYNGTIYTLDKNKPNAEAVAVRDGYILQAGSLEDLSIYEGEATQRIDLGQNFLYPGFIEGHAHIMGIGQNIVNVDLLGSTSYSDLIQAVVEKAQETPKGEWIVGRGWHQDKWETLPEGMFKGFPVHDALSNAVPDHPVYLKHASGHAALANARAMKIAEIDQNTKNPEGGEIFRTMNGKPTGIFNETAARLIEQQIPDESLARMERVLDLAMEECLKNGITSLHQAGSPTEHVELYKRFKESDRLKMRLYVMLSGKDSVLLDKYFSSGPEIDSTGWLTFRSVKLYSDGALGSRGAWLLEEYSDAPGEFGHNVTSMSKIENITMRAAAAGFQVCTHAIGDRGNREVLDIYEKAIREYPEKLEDHRFRIEHAQHVSQDDISRFAELNVIPSMQAIHMASDRPWAIDRLGKERIEEGAYVWQKFLQQGSKIVNGTDAPVEPVDPLACIYASVSRKTLKGTPEGGYEPSQKMTREQALRSYTIDAAYGAFQENIKGSIEKGKLADFTVLDKDIITIPENDILTTKILMTIVGGEIAFALN